MSGQYTLRPTESGWYLSFQLTEPVVTKSKALLLAYIRAWFRENKMSVKRAKVDKHHIEIHLTRKARSKR